MIILEKSVPPVYVDDSRDFQYFLRAYNVIMNMIKQDTDTLRYLTSSKECSSRVLQLLKTKLGFFTNYSIDDEMLRGILTGFPSMIKNKGSLESIREALNIFLRVLGIKTQVILKATGSQGEIVEGSIEVADHTILIAIDSAVQNYYILQELFKYIMPIGYQYSFYFYKKLVPDSWLLNAHTGRFLIVNTLDSDSIRSDTFFNQDFVHNYLDPHVDKMMNQINTINTADAYIDSDGQVVVPNRNLDAEEIDVDSYDFVMTPLTFEPECFESCYYYFYKLVNGRYYQLKHREEYVEDRYFIPQFLFINETDNDYELLTEEPVISNDDKTISLFRENYFDYYTLDNGVYRNLDKPVVFVANTYYKAVNKYGDKEKYYKAIANDVVSYAGIPVTSTYVSTIATINS